MIEVIDYKGGNRASLTRCLDRLGLEYRLADADTHPTGEYPMLLPGVGAFGATMAALKTNGLDEALCKHIRAGTPYLGICVGMQILFDASEEGPGVDGLGLLPGKVVAFRAPKVPQIGWNRITPSQSHPEMPEGDVYFVNSFYAAPENVDDRLYEADYSGPFCAGVRHENMTAYQFHPEKSGAFGHDLIKRWADAL